MMRPNVHSYYAKPVHALRPGAKKKPSPKPFTSLPKPPQPQKHSVKCCGRS